MISSKGNVQFLMLREEKKKKNCRQPKGAFICLIWEVGLWY